MIHMEEACIIIHTDSKKEESHLDTVAVLEAKRIRS